jgi:hypothetical protein
MKLDELTDDELRAEARRRGFELHSVQFSQAAQNALRELEGLRRRIDELLGGFKDSSRASQEHQR